MPQVGDLVERCLDDVADCWMKAEIIELHQDEGCADIAYCDDGAIERDVPFEEFRLFCTEARQSLPELLISRDFLSGPAEAFVSLLRASDLIKLEVCSGVFYRDGCLRDENLWIRCCRCDFESSSSSPSGARGRKRYQELLNSRAKVRALRESKSKSCDVEDVRNWALRNGVPASRISSAVAAHLDLTSSHHGYKC
eukprot:TRINITY_DN68909_c0_g1_i1.p1 TRINITY_DN68909_c0_g1~~TRINITY_DN68909_c0_g1_i1.p1  ORF type:complete len:196 (+),score=23.14 TRINITY_DN68909_c0_g1_i1:96-683(+)